MSRAPLVVIGDALLDLDVCASVPGGSRDVGGSILNADHVAVRPGGAALAASLAARQGHEVVLVTPIGCDAAGELLRYALAGRVELCPLPLAGRTPCQVRIVDPSGRRVRLGLGTGEATPGWSMAAMDAVMVATGVLISDQGRGSTAQAAVRAAAAMAADAVPVTWDPHPQGTLPIGGCTLVTPDALEAGGDRDHGRAASDLAIRWRAAVAVTLGELGAVVAEPGRRTRRIAPPASFSKTIMPDDCGAGDMFAAVVALALAAGASPYAAARRAVSEATAFVRSGGAASSSMVVSAGDVMSLLRA